MNCRLLAILLVLASVGIYQRRVDPKNTYHRILVVVPIVGTGTMDDPYRPKYAPWPPKPNGPGPKDIIRFAHWASDDKKSALVEFVAKDFAAFDAIRADHSVKVFEKGNDKKDDIEKELKKYKKDFNFDSFW